MSSSGRQVDISLGTLDGIQAALYFRRQMLQIAQPAPLFFLSSIVHNDMACLQARMSSSGRQVDISLGTLNGIQAALYFRGQMLAVPPLRPLTLMVKALLKVSHLGHPKSKGQKVRAQRCAVL